MDTRVLDIKVYAFQIPASEEVDSNLVDGKVEAGVWPSPIDTPEAEQVPWLREWLISNIVPGYIRGDYSKVDLVEDRILIRIYDNSENIILDTFTDIEKKYSVRYTYMR